MKDKIADILTVILMIGIYIGLPILLYVLIFKVYKNRRKGKERLAIPDGSPSRS
ncbi:MAG: hypothetical protein HFI66_09225 [Lachnospiraceae bacterium]|jgi:hypothetical protein|nr:hypothetical protein [Lachnospiraceae bacterium]